MEQSVEVVEKKYRDPPSHNKKYVKRLSEYISFLLKQGRVLEAKFYFDELNKIKPNHEKTLVFGYELSIKTFDNNGVLRFDTLLMKHKYNEQKLLCLRLKYYYSVHNAKAFDQIVLHLFNYLPIKAELLKIILPMIVQQNQYKSIAALCIYLKKNKMVLNDLAEKSIRRVVLQKLIDVMSEIKKCPLF